MAKYGHSYEKRQDKAEGRAAKRQDAGGGKLRAKAKRRDASHRNPKSHGKSY
jgi:hypothetical protein